ncbi:hypothetical protein SHELI_v1c03140 [Spiroplasma helicoides]|uniref:DUF2779 domain-containing protein n=1 Tax=Spiroplasma helicoides TaxID=216938 RepID=A0A1B3SK07_9MOLU|nr:DUF2779 domain-containing protein [Spiroplasma helicoides]AOG60269.1 hypothetical protein SHELI_v1c03140 [Spiroplasma helicoides]
MALKNVVKKEDFKKYFAVCQKQAWIFHDLVNFKKSIKFKKEKLYEFFINMELNDETEFDTSTGFDPLDIYEHLLNGEDLTEEEQKQRDILQKELESIEGLQLSPLSSSSIVDGNSISDASKEYFIFDLYKENRKNKTNYKYFDFSIYGYDEAIQKTQELLQNDEYKVLFEPSFESHNKKLRVRCDILINKGNRHIEIIEVKASTRQKKEHFYDLFYQWYTLERLGYTIDRIGLCLINENYYRGYDVIPDTERLLADLEEKIDYETEIRPILEKGIEVKSTGEPDDIDYESLFKIQYDYHSAKLSNSFITFFENICQQLNIEKILEEISESFDTDKILRNKFCGSYKFDYKNATIKKKETYCQHVVYYFDKNEPNLFDLPRFKQKAAEVHWNSGEIYFEEIKDKYDILNEKDEPYLDDIKMRLINVTNEYYNNNGNISSNSVVDTTRLPSLLHVLKDYIKYPIYMYDFETSYWAVPNFNRSKSYQQIPFQYSIHIIKDDKFDFKKSEETMDHYSFIASDRSDPRPEFLKKFLQDSFSHGPGVYVAYNRGFERMVIKHLMIAFPEFAKPLKYIWQNTIDLMDFFTLPKDNWLIYHPKFKGSASIKKTQPALDDSLTYNDLRIRKGDQASSVFRNFVDGAFDQEQWDNIFKNDMLLYCNRDTLAMVVVLQVVIKYIKDVKPDYREVIESWNK